MEGKEAGDTGERAMTIRTQSWTPDTHKDQTFICQWDDTDLEAPHVCIEVQGKGATKDPVVAQALFDAAIGLNKHKNLVVVPALLAALQASEKVIKVDEDGNEHIEFKNPPKFSVVDDKLAADFSAFKDAKAKSDAAAILDAENAKVP